ncbi:MAG: hypothetical protein KAH26_09025 [Bacteroidales bacterium]|nr:hypothetical protein [Bacteroidales bacterium]
MENENQTNENQTSDNISKGKEMGQKAFDEAKEATGQAVKALKSLISDPIGGQYETLKDLGKSNALRAGIVFAVIFAIASYLLGHSFIATALAFGGGSGLYFKLIIFSVIPPIAVFALFYLVMKFISKEKEELSTVIYTTGVSVIPLALLFFCIKIIGLSDSILLPAIGIFCISTTFLLINSFLQDIYKLSTRKSVLITPTIVFVAGYVSGLIFQVLMN